MMIPYYAYILTACLLKIQALPLDDLRKKRSYSSLKTVTYCFNDKMWQWHTLC